MRILFLALFAAATGWQSSVPARQHRGTVAVLPVQNTSGEKWRELKARQTTKIEDWLRTHLPAAGYRLVDAREVETALRTSGMDPSQSKNWTAEALASVGDACSASHVLLCVVTFTEQKEQRRIWYVDKEGRTDVRVWLIETASRKALLDGETLVGRSGGNRISFDNKGSDRQVQAAANAVRDALRDFLAPYRAK